METKRWQKRSDISHIRCGTTLSQMTVFLYFHTIDSESVRVSVWDITVAETQKMIECARTKICWSRRYTTMKITPLKNKIKNEYTPKINNKTRRKQTREWIFPIGFCVHFDDYFRVLFCLFYHPCPCIRSICAYYSVFSALCVPSSVLFILFRF